MIVNIVRIRCIITCKTNASIKLNKQMHMYGTCSRFDTEAMDVKGQYKTGVWYHIAAVLGASNAEGKIGQVIMQGSSYGFDYADWGWCLDDNSDFIEAIQLPGGVMISPIQITPRPIAVKPLQEKYYTQVRVFSLRPSAMCRLRCLMPDRSSRCARKTTCAFSVGLQC